MDDLSYDKVGASNGRNTDVGKTVLYSSFLLCVGDVTSVSIICSVSVIPRKCAFYIQETIGHDMVF